MKAEWLKIANLMHEEMLREKAKMDAVTLAMQQPIDSVSLRVSIQFGERVCSVSLRGKDSDWDQNDISAILASLLESATRKFEARRYAFENYNPV